MFERLRRAGHFVYESGDHGDTWLDLEGLLSDAVAFDDLVGRLSAEIRHAMPEVVCGPLFGGAFVAQAVARHLGVRFVATAPPDYSMSRDGAALVRNARLAVVDDVVNAGSSIGATARAITAAGGTVVVTGALATRVPGNDDVVRVYTLEFQTWSPSKCPLCQAGAPIDTPS